MKDRFFLQISTTISLADPCHQRTSKILLFCFVLFSVGGVVGFVLGAKKVSKTDLLVLSRS